MANLKPLVVFYAWQSDLPNKTNRGFIKDALQRAIKELNKTVSIEDAERDAQPSIKLDHATEGVVGAVDLAATIFEKIRAADVFVADVSFIGASPADMPRLVSNPNVLVETGYALAFLGPTKVIMVLNTATGSSEELPFDIKGKLHISYRAEEESPGNTNEKQGLVRTFVGVLKLLTEEAPAPLSPVEIEIALVVQKQQLNVTHKQWAFNMQILARNTTKTTIVNCELVVRVPKGLIAQGSQLFVSPTKSTETHTAFVHPASHLAEKRRLMPGKKELLLSIDCLLHAHNLAKMSETMEQSIEVELYADDTEAQSKTVKVIELNPYRLLNVDAESLEYHKTYRVDEFANERPEAIPACQCHP